jgi:hypothetical protein
MNFERTLFDQTTYPGLDQLFLSKICNGKQKQRNVPLIQFYIRFKNSNFFVYKREKKNFGRKLSCPMKIKRNLLQINHQNKAWCILIACVVFNIHY